MNLANGHENTPVSERVVEAVAQEIKKEPTELEPLYHSVQPKRLDEMFPAPVAASDDSVRQFTFTYEDHIVNISHDGTVDVYPAGGQTPNLSPTDSADSAGQGEPQTPD